MTMFASPALLRLFGRVLQGRYPIVGVFLLLTAAGIYGASRIPTDTSIDRLIVAGDPTAEATLEFERVFPEGEQALIILDAKDPLSPAALQGTDRLEYQLDKIPRVVAHSLLTIYFRSSPPAAISADDAERLRTFATGTSLFRRAGLLGEHYVAIALDLEVKSPAERDRALAAIESWLVRRAVLRYTGKNYNRSLTALLKDIKENLADADVAVVNELASSQAETALWPSDDAVLARLEMGEVYGYIGLSRLRMLLEACELDVRDGRTESKLVAPGLTIEHALPQAWEEYWPTPDGMDLEAFRKKRNDHVHRLGNLTLITQPLNSTLSNAPWTATATCPNSKRDELRKRSVMLINQQLCEYDEWNEERIDERSAELARHILRTWPGPHSTIWTTPCV